MTDDVTIQDVEGGAIVKAVWHVRFALRRQRNAAEAASTVGAAAHEVGIVHLIAIIGPDNLASQCGARKIGFALEGEIHKDGDRRWSSGPIFALREVIPSSWTAASGPQAPRLSSRDGLVLTRGLRH